MASNKVTEACDLEKLSVRDLKLYLRERGGHVSGTKGELLNRAIGLKFLGTKTLQELNSYDAEEADRRRSEKFKTPLGESLPEPWTIKGGWSSVVDVIPTVQETDLYNYLVLNRRRTFDTESIKAKRQLKAKVFYEDKHVHSILFNNIDENNSHGYVKCKVIPSLPTGTQKQKPDYDVWVCLSKVTGNIHSAGCTCSAGEGESCNHVAALLYALVDITKKKKEGLNSVTSSKCKWTIPRKRKLTPKKAEELVFKKHKFIETDKDPKCRKKLNLKDSKPTVKPMDINFIVNEMKKHCPNAAFLYSNTQYLMEKQQPNSEIPNIHYIPFMYNRTMDLNSEECLEMFENYFNKLSISQSDCDTIEQKSRGQTKNKIWDVERKGRITSSNFGAVCKMRQTTSPECMVNNIFGYSEFHVKSVEWGSSHEAAARRVYVKQSLKTHPKLKIFTSGLIVSPKYPHLGSSPDALVQCEHCDEQMGVLEVKCPYKWRYLTPLEAAKDKTFYCELINNKVTLKRHHSYYYQVQGQMAITGRPWCDFFVWTLQGFSIERIYFDAEFWANMLLKLNKFYKGAVIPEMFSLRVKYGLKL